MYKYDQANNDNDDTSHMDNYNWNETQFALCCTNEALHKHIRVKIKMKIERERKAFEWKPTIL